MRSNGETERERSTLSISELEGKEGRDSLEIKDREVDLEQYQGQMTHTHDKTSHLSLDITDIAPVKHKSVITVHVHMQIMRYT